MKSRLIVFLVLFLASAKHSLAQRILTVPEIQSADVIVHVLVDNGRQDLNVLEVAYSFQARGNHGLWFKALHPRLADKKVYFTDNRSEADLVIRYVSSVSKAGWVSLQKQHLLD